MEKTVKILQLTDFHLFGDKSLTLLGVNPTNTLNEVLELVKNDLKFEQPELILFTGDLSQDNSSASYQRVLNIIKRFSQPLAVTMGNHENPTVFMQKLGHLLQKHFHIADWNIIILNTHWPNHVGGMLHDDEVEFLSNTLKQSPAKFTTIFLHHHVLPVQSHWVDNLGLNNSDKFLNIIDQYKNINLVVCGHVHQDSFCQRNGVDYISTPSTCWQFACNSYNFKLDTIMPGYRWIYLNADGSYITKLTRVSHNTFFIPDLTSEGY